MRTTRIVFTVLLCLLGQSLFSQVLEIHQMAAQNADAGCIIIRDTSKVLDILRLHAVRQVDATKVTPLKTALTTMVYDGFTTQKFMYQLALSYLSPLDQVALTGRLGIGFSLLQPDITALKNGLTELSGLAGGANFATAQTAIDNFQTQYNTLFENDFDKNRINMTQYALDLQAAAAVVDKPDYSLAETIKEIVVIDAGREGDKAGDGPDFISKYLKLQGVTTKIDRFILSHNHDDHFGGFKKVMEYLSPATITTSYEQGYYYLKPKTFGKKMKTLFREPMKDALGYDNLTSFDAIKLFNNNNDTVSTRRKVPMPKDTLQLQNGVVMNCVASNCFVIGAPNFNKPMKLINKNENDYSLAWVLTYGNFKYFTGGDLSGFNGFTIKKGKKKQSFCGNYHDIESSLITNLANNAHAPFMAGNTHVCGLKISHHGSQCSSNDAFLSGLKATVALIPNGVDNKHSNPDKETFERIFAAKSDTKVYCAGLMKDLSRGRVFPLFKNFLVPNDYLDKKVFVTGNTALIVDDEKIIGLKPRFMIKWDGAVNVDRDKDEEKYDQLQPPTPKGKTYFDCTH